MALLRKLAVVWQWLKTNWPSAQRTDSDGKHAIKIEAHNYGNGQVTINVMQIVEANTTTLGTQPNSNQPRLP